MTFDLDRAFDAVVASGTVYKIKRWGKLLRDASIEYQVRQFCDDHLPNRVNHAELWVGRGTVDRARSVIRGSDDADETLLW